MTAGRSINTQSQHWGTPKVYVEAVKKVFADQIELDPCSNEYSIVHAQTEYRLPKNDGLYESWDFKTIFVNPPYGLDKIRRTSIKQWLARCYDAYKTHHSQIIALVPVATNTGHWKNFVFGKAQAICFLYDTRLKFLEKGEDGSKGAPMSCAMIYWGENYQAFYDVFIAYGAVVDIRPLKNQAIGQEKTKTVF
jgi:hypothetical protein